MIISLLILLTVGVMWLDFRQQGKRFMAKVSGLEGRFTALGDRVQKIIDEIKTLKETLSDTDLPAATEASLLRLEGLTQLADDENPDAVVIPPVDPPVEPPV